MYNLKIYQKRLQQLIDEIHRRRYSDAIPMESSFIYNPDHPIPLEEIRETEFKTIQIGESWGDLWGSAWFRFTAELPPTHRDGEILALIDIDAEGCVFVGGSPERGLTHKKTKEGPHVKRRVPIQVSELENFCVSILVEGAANGLFGKEPENAFTLRQAEVVKFNRPYWELSLDLQILFELAQALPEDSPRARKLYSSLNRIANLWNDGQGFDECKTICVSLLAKKANESEMTVWSVGHAHIDLGWLWPVRETRRKGGRTFATALRLIEEYPDYVFGASQPQLYEWIKQDYPKLYEEVKKAIHSGRWECQGAMWVEPDTNVTGGESLVRQCLYGINFYRDEFGKEVKNLWIPDVFGYSAALPQIIRKSGVDVFMTQKMSWNETNTFPHHTFLWEGIDGTRVLTHFLPTNTYNCVNSPSEFIEAQKRFIQAGSQDDFLNLYGIGDGGGGPSRSHIERALRMRDTEGSPKLKLSSAESFFDKISTTPAEELPLWCGELYLEFHRGTLTSQALMKLNNRRLERSLRNLEIIANTSEEYPTSDLESIWKDTLLNQFHDILPGSSINWVYKDAHAMSEKNLNRLETLTEKYLQKVAGCKTLAGGKTYIVWNTLSWRRREVIRLAAPKDGTYGVFDAEGKPLHTCQSGDSIFAIAEVPPMGYTSLTLKEPSQLPAFADQVTCTKSLLENDLVKIELAEDGTISSIFDKTIDAELLEGPANQILLWEDLPYAFDAWDVSHYYRETKPEQAKLIQRSIVDMTPLRCCLLQKFTIGKSEIEQRISLDVNSKMVTIKNTVDWREEKKMMKVHAETAVHSRSATYEIQFGHIERATHANTSWDQARFEVAGQRYADLSCQDRGLSLINDCKYGYSTYLNSLELSLLRSPVTPDPEADRHQHEFTYAYRPHGGNLLDSGTYESAHELDTPLLVFEVETLPTPVSRSAFSIDGKNVAIEAIKKAENGDGTICRIYETAGTYAAVCLTAESKWRKVTETNLIEEPLKSLAEAGREVDLRFTPFEIKTILIQ